MRDADHPQAGKSRVQWIGVVAGPLSAAVLVWLLPSAFEDASGELAPFSPAGRATLAVLVWMAIWWLTEAIDLAATALLPLAVFPVLGAADIEGAAAPYADPMIFLFMGGFLIAISMQRWGLDRRIALLTLRVAGPRPGNMVAGFMVATAVLSAFVSNTATTAMMLPIAASVVGLSRSRLGEAAMGKSGSDESGVGKSGSETRDRFATCLMLGIAYSASLGGVMTLIGTPPNAFLASFLRDSIAEPYRVEISFGHWMLIGVPMTVVFLPITWWLLTRVVFPIGGTAIEGGRELVDRELALLGRPARGERITGGVFVAVAVAWIFRPLLTSWSFELGGATWAPLSGLTDPGIAMAGALALFVLPSGDREHPMTMTWDAARKLPFGILILFGGGLSLAHAVHVNGVAEFLGSQTRAVSGIPEIAVVVLVITAIIFLTELTSNLATAATLLPILAAIAPTLGIHPYWLVIPAGIAASCAFMLPVATPPNAIVFGSGFVTQRQMIRAGFWLNLIGIGLITLLAKTLLGPWIDAIG